MAVDIFIKIGDIKGESMDKAHKDEIDVLNWSWGMAHDALRQRQAHRQGQADRAQGRW
jgi:type VI protein secretion system component Hcp